MKFLLSAFVFILPAAAAISPFAEYQLGEKGSLSTTGAPQDSFGIRHFTHSSGSPAPIAATDGVSPRFIDRLMIDEFEQSPNVGRIQSFRIQAWDNNTWKTIHTGTTCGRHSLHSFSRVETSKLRIAIDSATEAPSIWEIQPQDSLHATIK